MDNEIPSPVPPPKVTHKWVNITDVFKDTVKDLKLGELLHDDLFGLFEAMSAIEMMDPKMDAGMLCNRGTRKILSFDQAVKDGYIKLNDFTETELIGIIDTTLACLVSWLEGHSLAQTVFINLYLHKPYSVEERVLKVFSLSVYKLLEVIKDVLHKAMVYEEEDFQPMQYGYHLNPDISEQRMIGMLREIEEELHRKMRAKQNEDTQALFARIKFVRIFLQVLNSLRKDDQPQTSFADSQRLLQNSLEMLTIMKDTIHLGFGADKGDGENIPGFEMSINQRLLPPTFPRYTKIKSRPEAVAHFTDMMERFKVVCKIHSVTSFHQALDFFMEFSKTGPCLVSRSGLQLLYPGSQLKEALREAARSFIGPPALTLRPLTTNAQARQQVDGFLSRCTRPFNLLLQLCGHNRARQRDKLAHLLEEFGALQDEAERVDAFLHNLSVSCGSQRPHMACFGTWILYHTLRIMIMYLLAGFELELYSIHEYYYIYWYLYEFLYGWLISALSRANSFLVENEMLNENQAKKGGGKKKAQKPNKKKTRPYNRDIIYLQALQNMCGGYYKALLGFLGENLVGIPDRRFDKERVRYEHRFSPFEKLPAPPPVAYAEFREAAAAAASAGAAPLFVAGCRHFQQARTLLEALQPPPPDAANLLKACKTNFVLLRLLASGHRPSDPKVSPTFDFAPGCHFPVMKLG